MPRILTGSFDKTVKVWSMDGKLVRRIDNFYGTITSMCYVRRTNLVWVADGSYDACLIDVNSGDNVSHLSVNFITFMLIISDIFLFFCITERVTFFTNFYFRFPGQVDLLYPNFTRTLPELYPNFTRTSII